MRRFFAAVGAFTFTCGVGWLYVISEVGYYSKDAASFNVVIAAIGAALLVATKR